jgi:exo-1,4-beta-D-glucosaminidase
VSKFVRPFAVFLVLMFAAGPLRAETSPNMAELGSGWQLQSARDVSSGGAAISQASFVTRGWHSIPRMPATVLQALIDSGAYTNVYYGMNLATKVPQDLWKQDWWYRTTFTAPAGKEAYSLIFKGINYRADIWLNGHLIAGKSQVVGMYNSFELDVRKYIHPGATNALAVQITPEQKIEDVNGVELADSWADWINWKYLGYQELQMHNPISLVPDRNAGVWKRVYLSSTGKVSVRHPYVTTDLPLPATSPASLVVYCDLRNAVPAPVTGVLRGEITRLGKPTIHFEQNVTLQANEAKEVSFAPREFPQLSVANPDLWWPSLWGTPNLYGLKLDLTINGEVSDSATINFGIREVTQHRDSDDQFPKIGQGGNFYLRVNGRDFLVRGAYYMPDLLFKNDPNRDRALMSYVKDLGINMLRWEGKFADDDMLDLADQEGIPVLMGWMCCNQWEDWDQWDEEDHWVARASMRAQILDLRYHTAMFIWANGSDGRPPSPVLSGYRKILGELHWRDAIVDTLSHFKKGAKGYTLWDGIHMLGPYSWRPPYYWFSGQFAAPRGANAEQSDIENVPPFESLKKFIPPDKLWPPNDFWYFHAAANEGNNTLANIQKAIEKRYGVSSSAEEFAKKAQLAHYENTRAQFEDFAASGWTNHKMTIYLGLNSMWPSFYGHLFDYYLKPGGAYFGAKQGLRPLSVVFDHYATGDRRDAQIYVVNQTFQPQSNLKVSVKFYNLDGNEKYSEQVANFDMGSNTSRRAFLVPRVLGLSSTYFVRCQLRDATDTVLADNLYWESTTDDDLGGPRNDDKPFALEQTSWADFSALNNMPRVEVSLTGTLKPEGDNALVAITVANDSDQVAFFMRAEVTQGKDSEEVLPITYDDNYVTLFAHESRTLHARFKRAELDGHKPFVRLEGYNVSKITSPVQ